MYPASFLDYSQRVAEPGRDLRSLRANEGQKAKSGELQDQHTLVIGLLCHAIDQNPLPPLRAEQLSRIRRREALLAFQPQLRFLMTTEDIVEGVPSLSDPPPYAASIAAPLLPRQHPAFAHPQASATGLPSGFFLLRSRAPSQRTFDLLGHRQNDGAEVCTRRFACVPSLTFISRIDWASSRQRACIEGGGWLFECASNPAEQPSELAIGRHGSSVADPPFAGSIPRLRRPS